MFFLCLHHSSWFHCLAICKLSPLFYILQLVFHHLVFYNSFAWLCKLFVLLSAIFPSSCILQSLSTILQFVCIPLHFSSFFSITLQCEFSPLPCALQFLSTTLFIFCITLCFNTFTTFLHKTIHSSSSCYSLFILLHCIISGPHAFLWDFLFVMQIFILLFTFFSWFVLL